MNLVKQAQDKLEQKEFDQAYDFAQRALAINPNAPMAHQVIGRVLLKRDQPAEALPALHKAIAIRPDWVGVQNCIGQCHMMLGELAEAQKYFDRALSIEPGHAQAHFNRACACLKQERYKEGWVEYEWRWPAGLVTRTPIPRPRWDGSPLNGKSILIHTEQGMGDVLQFMRFLPLVKSEAGAGRLVFACQKAMQSLLKPTACVDEWFPIDEPANITFDFYAPLLSLPGLLGIDGNSLKQPIPYVFADSHRIERWRKTIGEMPGLKVGLCWQGSPTFEGDHIRSIPLKHFAPLGKVPSVTLISLQTMVGVEQIEAFAQTTPLRVLEDLDKDGAFVDRAAILSHLDLLVTSDTSLAHLAGAMGRPVWILLSTGSDWRWLMDRTDSPWYPSMRLFRQKQLGDWPAVMQDVVGELAKWAR
jgi:hypothetical protein